MHNSNIMLLALIGKVVYTEPLPKKEPQPLGILGITFAVCLGLAVVVLAFI